MKMKLKNVIKKSIRESIEPHQLKGLIWDKSAISELLEAVGQDNIRYRNDSEGVSEGDYGTTKFQVVDNTKRVLYLKFQNESVAKGAFSKISSALTNPYEFSTRHDIMPNVVMVKFTENV